METGRDRTRRGGSEREIEREREREGEGGRERGEREREREREMRGGGAGVEGLQTKERKKDEERFMHLRSFLSDIIGPLRVISKVDRFVRLDKSPEFSGFFFFLFFFFAPCSCVSMFIFLFVCCLFVLCIVDANMFISCRSLLHSMRG